MRPSLLRMTEVKLGTQFSSLHQALTNSSWLTSLSPCLNEPVKNCHGVTMIKFVYSKPPSLFFYLLGCGQVSPCSGMGTRVPLI